MAHLQALAQGHSPWACPHPPLAPEPEQSRPPAAPPQSPGGCHHSSSSQGAAPRALGATWVLLPQRAPGEPQGIPSPVGTWGSGGGSGSSSDTAHQEHLQSASPCRPGEGAGGLRAPGGASAGEKWERKRRDWVFHGRAAETAGAGGVPTMGEAPLPCLAHTDPPQTPPAFPHPLAELEARHDHHSASSG